MGLSSNDIINCFNDLKKYGQCGFVLEKAHLTDQIFPSVLERYPNAKLIEMSTYKVIFVTAEAADMYKQKFIKHIKECEKDIADCKKALSELDGHQF